MPPGNFLTCVRPAKLRPRYVVRRAKPMNVQQLNPLLPASGGRTLPPLLAAAFRLEASVPDDMEARLAGLPGPLPLMRQNAAR